MKRKFLLFVAAALISQAGIAFAQPMADKEKMPPPKPVTYEEKIQAMVDKLSGRLNLAPEQQAKVKDILIKTEKGIQDFVQDVKTKVQDMRKDQKMQIDAVLTPEQKAMLEQEKPPMPKKPMPMPPEPKE